MSTLTIRIPESKHARLRSLARARGVSINRLTDELATSALAQHDAETRFRGMAGGGSRKRGLAWRHRIRWARGYNPKLGCGSRNGTAENRRSDTNMAVSGMTCGREQATLIVTHADVKAASRERSAETFGCLLDGAIIGQHGDDRTPRRAPHPPGNRLSRRHPGRAAPHACASGCAPRPDGVFATECAPSVHIPSADKYEFHDTCHGSLEMDKPGIVVDIPGFGRRHIRVVVSDYTGTYSIGGAIEPDVKRRLQQLITLVELHIVTADSFGTSERELAEIVAPYKLRTGRHDVEKAAYVKQFDMEHVAALGNGNNDRLMLQAVREGGGIAIAVDNGEGCAMDAMRNADVFVTGAANALDLLLDPTRLKATLRF